MMPDVEIWWIWMAAGALLAAAEFIVPGFFIIPFIAGAIAAGMSAYAGFGATVQWTVFGVVSVVLLPAALVVTKRMTKNLPPVIDSSRMIGMRGPVTIAINNREGTGHVLLGGELWRAESDQGEDISVGIVVEVTAVRGICILVKKAGKEQ